MSWFSLGAPTTKKECKKPCCENKHGHSHGGQQQQQQQQIPPQIQQALAQGFTPMQPITPAELKKMQADGLSQQDIMAKLQEKAMAMKEKAVAEGLFIEAPKFTEAKDGYAFQMGPYGVGYYKQMKPTPEQIKAFEEKRKQMMKLQEERLAKEPIHDKFLRAVKVNDFTKIKELIKENEKEIKRQQNSISIDNDSNGSSPNKTKKITVPNLCAYKSPENGFTPLHWACLGGNVELIEFLLDNRANIDEQNNRGEPPLFWSVIKGHTKVVRCLMDRNCDLQISDDKGYNVMHHAAQNNQIALLHIFLQKGLPLETTDTKGRTALHWACYQDHDRLAEWLIRKGAGITALDVEQMSPLHWAAIKGNYRSVKALIRAGASSMLNVTDAVDKKTPEELAGMKASKAKHQHDKVRYLKLAKYLRGIEGIFHWRKHLGVVERYAQKGFFLGFGGFFTYWALFVLPFGFYLWYQYMMIRTSHLTFWTLLFVSSFTAQFYVWYMASFMDPGNIVVDTSNGKQCKTAPGLSLLREQYNAALMSGDNTVKLCLSCEIVKPERSKHCSVTNKCVDRFDHYCPWVNNDVGRRNYAYFLLFLVFTIFTGVSFNVLNYYYVTSLNGGQGYWHAVYEFPGYNIFVMHYFFYIMFSVAMIGGHLDLLKNGMTTNEAMNAYRYSYLQHPNTGKKYNPYDEGGVFKNLRAVFADRGRATGDCVKDLMKKTNSIRKRLTVETV